MIYYPADYQLNCAKYKNDSVFLTTDTYLKYLLLFLLFYIVFLLICNIFAKKIL
jgi:hypothetical protein